MKAFEEKPLKPFRDYYQRTGKEKKTLIKKGERMEEFDERKKEKYYQCFLSCENVCLMREWKDAHR